MATCPYCLGALTDGHKCPRKRQTHLLLTTGFAVVGAAAGFIAMALLDPTQRSTHLDVWVIAMAAFIAAGFYHVLRRTN